MLYCWAMMEAAVSAELGFDLGATLAPAGPGPEPWNKAHRAGYNIWSAFKSSKVPDLALKFVTHLGYGAGAEPWAATGKPAVELRFGSSPKAYFWRLGTPSPLGSASGPAIDRLPESLPNALSCH